MEYSKINVNAFAGLDANKRPELLRNEEASDIENLRFEKLGYLTNRNGVQSKSLKYIKQSTAIDVKNSLWPIGVGGLTEYVLKASWGPGSGTTSWAPYDDTTLNSLFQTQTNRHSDRFMVYNIRIPSRGIPAGNPNIQQFDTYNQDNHVQYASNHYTWRYKAAYILIPLTGPTDFRDIVPIAPNGFPYIPININNPNQGNMPDPDYPSLTVTVGARSILRADDKPSKTQIYAPVRWLGVHNTFEHDGIPKDQNWIEHYVTMQQYRDTIVISDMVNRDMQLVDEYAEAEYNEERKHRFTLRENCLAKFDIDDVVVDFGIGEGQFNNGVKAPMALYKFYLPKKNFVTTNDRYKPVFNDVDISPTYDKVQFGGDGVFGYWRPIDPNKLSSFMAVESILSISDDSDLGTGLILPSIASYAGYTFNVSDNYTYTNSQPGESYVDVFSSVTLQNPDIKQEDQKSTDVYLWKDLEINYYPSSGASNAYGSFLTATDRTWDKTSSTSSKIVKLKTHTGVEQDVPLGVWRYRFVWYLGNGEYSSPSTELVVPDLLFSGLKDSDISNAVPNYKRPIGTQSLDEALSTAMDLTSPNGLFMNNLTVAQGIKIFQNDGPPTAGTLTTFGTNFIKVKQELYDPSHRFSARESSTNGTLWPTNWAAESHEAKGNVATICTVFFENDDVVLNGNIGEAAHSQYTWVGKTLLNEDAYKPRTLQLNVPIFPRDSEDYSFNCLATDSGVIRTIYQNKPQYQSSTNFNFGFPAYDIVTTGQNSYGASSFRYNGITERGGKVYINVVAFANAFNQDRNNSPDDDLYISQYRLSYRNMTQTRAIKEESDKMSFLKRDIPTEVADRIVLSGSCEIPICDYTDTGTWRPQEARGKITINNTSYNLLERPVQRAFLSTAVPPLGSLLTPIVGGTSFDYVRSNDPNYTSNNPYLKFQNLKVIVSAPAERLLIHEQLSMYVPASLLFDAPHVKLVIPSDRIPRRARQLMIFRTRASHDNAWQPHEYGFVKAIDIMREKTTGLPDGEHEQKVEFLDDVKTEDMDFSYNLDDFEGFVEPIASRFCLPLNERVFYANIKESYKPKAPRNSVMILRRTSPQVAVEQRDHKNLNYGATNEMERLWNYKITMGDAATTNITRRYLYYFLAYNDAARSYSLASFSGVIDRGFITNDPQNVQNYPNRTKKVIFYCLPSAYDPSIEHINIYRLQLDAPLTQIAFSDGTGAIPNKRESIAEYSTGVYYVAQGVVEYNGVVYYPNSVIKAFDGRDTGVPDDSQVGQNLAPQYFNKFVNYFSQYVDPYQAPVPPTYLTGKTNRGAMMSYCEPIVYDITPYFDKADNPADLPYIEKIGDIKPEAEGIFYDDDLKPLGRLPILQFFQNEDVLNSGLRWSEPYQPNKLKLGSLAEIRSGDGDQITGLVQLYGNLIILKERSIHRMAVQGSSVPVSRTDEISNNVGCIAPNTAIVVNNTLYFLSWAGFYKYDNNVLSKVDGQFAEELQVRLRSSINGVTNPAIRDASCGWNPTYRELYLNIPVMSTNNNEGHYGVSSMANQNHTQGVTLMDNVGVRDVRGTVYAINVDTGLVTKYRYMDDSLYFTDPYDPSAAITENVFLNARINGVDIQRAPRVTSRLYYTNTLGQLRSAECLPPRTYNYNLVSVFPPAQDPGLPASNNASMSYLQTSFFIESPTKESNSDLDKYKDDMMMYSNNGGTTPWENAVNFRNVRVFWQSKSWTGDDKTMLKRVRKVYAYVSSTTQPAVIRGITHTSPTGGRALTDISWEYAYWNNVVTVPPSPAYGQAVEGELSAVPTEAAGSSTAPSQNRGERHIFQVEGGGSFQMEYFGFYWKPINIYQR
jgi:hypothetical protein